MTPRVAFWLGYGRRFVSGLVLAVPAPREGVPRRTRETEFSRLRKL